MPPSVPRTEKVSELSASAVVVSGELQAVQAPPSIRHSKVVPDLSAEKLNAGVASLSFAAGFVSMLAIVTATTVKDALVPVRPLPSVATTVCVVRAEPTVKATVALPPAFVVDVCVANEPPLPVLDQLTVPPVVGWPFASTS